MKHLLHLLLFFLALTFTSQGKATGFSSCLSDKENILGIVATDDDTPEPTHHAPHNTQIAEQPSPIAILSNPQDNYRFSNSRPQRLLPVYGNKQQRCNGKLPFHILCHKPKKCSLGIIDYYASASSMPIVSLNDFFLVLRHIVR